MESPSSFPSKEPHVPGQTVWPRRGRSVLEVAVPRRGVARGKRPPTSRQLGAPLPARAVSCRLRSRCSAKTVHETDEPAAYAAPRRRHRGREPGLRASGRADRLGHEEDRPVLPQSSKHGRAARPSNPSPRDSRPGLGSGSQTRGHLWPLKHYPQPRRLGGPRGPAS